MIRLLAVLFCLTLTFAVMSEPVQQDDINSKIEKEPAGNSSTPLPAAMTAEEWEAVRKMPPVRAFRAGRKPTGTFTAPAEYEPADALFLSWKGWEDLLAQMAKFVAEDSKVYIAYDYNLSAIKSKLSSVGANLSNIEFLNVPLDAVWMRDFGPWWILKNGGNREIIDTKYYRDRQNDDAFPIKFGQLKGIPVNESNLITEGGNIMLDGHGVAIISDVQLRKNSWGVTYTKEQVEQIYRDYFGVNRVIWLKRLKDGSAGGTGHIDIQMKLLNDNTIIVSQHSGPSAGYSGNYEILEENARIMANETNGLGQKFNVVRIPMPDHPRSTYTYTNSLIINKKVLVPVFGIADDERALEIYRNCLPGYDVQGFDSSDIINYGGAIHCTTITQYTDGMKLIYNPARAGKAGEPVTVRLEVESRNPLSQDGARLFWSTERNGAYQPLKLSLKNGAYQGQIPAQTAGTRIYYFFSAEDLTGSYLNLPAGAPDTEVYNLIFN
ncbi:MAG: agmatine deiminase family protein [Candidatus Wallbacteria bacterium]|nr:agmatine deiminase family protein [Candidatus Wallbacteria bacterium]